MQPTDVDHKKMFGELIKKQMLILGPDITLAKVKNVPGITVDQNGEVVGLTGDPQQLLQLLINQFVELSGMIVKKTMESILTAYPNMAGFTSQPPVQQAVPVINNAPLVTDTPTPVSHEPVQADPPKASPPSITDIVGNGSTDLISQKPEENVPTPSSSEMQNLNKALEDLAHAPLATENHTQ